MKESLYRVKETVTVTLKDARLSLQTGHVCIPSPVFITVDDCGFPRVYPDDLSTPEVGLETYESLLTLAKQHHTRIVLAFTTRYLDRNNASPCARPLPYLGKLMNLLKQNRQHLEIADHGWIHSHDNHIGEFYLVDERRPVSRHLQEQSVRRSASIYRSWGLEFPRVFVPPFGAFVPGVLDEILSQHGVEYLISTSPGQRDRLVPASANGDAGGDLALKGGIFWLPRSWLGVLAINTDLNRALFTSMRRELLTVNRNGGATPCRMTHIGNFLPHNRQRWQQVFEYASKKPFLYLPRDIDQAVSQWLFLKYGSWRCHTTSESAVVLLDATRVPCRYAPHLGEVVVALRGSVQYASSNGHQLRHRTVGDLTHVNVPIGTGAVQRVAVVWPAQKGRALSQRPREDGACIN